MLVFRCVHIRTELIGCEPELGFEADVGSRFGPLIR